MTDDRNMEKEAMCLFLIFITLLFSQICNVYWDMWGWGWPTHDANKILRSYTKFCILWNMMIDA